MLTRRDFAPDEIRNNVRDWPMAVQKANQEVADGRARTRSRRRPGWRPSDDERRRRHDAALLGAELAAEPVGLQGRQRDRRSATARRASRPGRPSRTGRSATTSSSRTTTRSSTKSASRDRPATSTARSIRAATSSRRRASATIRCRRCAGPASSRRWPTAAKGLGWHPFPGRRRSTRDRSRTAPAACITASATAAAVTSDAKNSTAVTTIPRAEATGKLKVVTRAHGHVDRRRSRQGASTGVTYVTDGQEYFQPAKVVLLASYTYENVRLLLLSKSKAFPNGLSNNHGQVGRHYLSHHQGAGVTALFPFDLKAWYGLPAQGVAVDNFADDNFDHGGLDFIGGGNLWVYSDRRPIGAANMNTFGAAPAGARRGRRSSKRTPTARTRRTSRRRRCRTRPTSSISIRTVKDPLGFPVMRITAEYKENERQHRRAHAGQDGAVVSRGRRDRHRARAGRRHDGADDARLRRHADGRQPRNQRRQSLGLLARGAEPRRPRRAA